MFLKELMLIKQANKESPIFLNIAIFFHKDYKFQPNICNECHDLSTLSVNLSDDTILNIKSADYHCIIIGISKWPKLIKNSNLTKTSETL